MIEEFNRLCVFRQNYPGVKGSRLSVKDPLLDAVIADLSSIKKTLEDNYAYYRGFELSFDISKGQGNSPNVFHVSILPPDQKVSNGIYVVMCFDIRGRGALVGCAESVTKPQGLRTDKRKEPKSKLSIDVDGSGKNTKYNNSFQNPIEFFYPLKSDSGLLSHITHSLDIALAELKLIPGEEEIIGSRKFMDFNPINLEDGRNKIARLITARRGQPKFRRGIMNAYGSKCTVTGNEIEYIIEAAHIIPFLGDETNHIQNGLPLRSDIHLLFDMGLITIDAMTLKIKLSKKLYGTDYWKYDGREMFLPENKFNYPSREALKDHNQRFEKNQNN